MQAINTSKPFFNNRFLISFADKFIHSGIAHARSLIPSVRVLAAWFGFCKESGG